MLALDIDGTLLNSRKEISARTLRAIADAIDTGVRVALVTGRRHPAARRIADLLPCDPPMILHNGGLVIEKARPIRVKPLNRATATDVVRFAKGMNADPVVHFGHAGEGLLYVETTSPSHTLLAYYLSRSHPDVRLVPSLKDALAREREDPLQVMFGGSMNEMQQLAAAIAATSLPAAVLRTVYPEDNLSLIDVVAPSVDKSEALAFLCSTWGFGLPDVLAIGDNWNDRSMLMEAGRGCVMGNADAELRALGLDVVPSNDEDGVAWAVERFILGVASQAGQ